MIRESIYKRYTPGVVPPQDIAGKSWWFIFSGNKLLVESTDDREGIPFIEDPGDAGIKTLHRQYLGMLGGCHCFSAEAADTVDVLPGYSFRDLRSLMGILEDDVFLLAGKAFQVMNWDRNNQYCGRCGTLTDTMQDERAKKCPKCGFTSYTRISPAIIVAIIRDGKILLAHANRFASNRYSVIAGFVEPGETFEECVKREVMEEVGLEVGNIRYFGSQPWPFPDSLMVAFTAQYADGEIAVDGVEISDAGWYSKDRLPAIPEHGSVARSLIEWYIENY